MLPQNLFFRSRQSEIAIGLSTLTSAALFKPLRRRLQYVVDRRFYRQKVGAQRVLARFAVAARDEVALEALTAALLGAVQQTMQPERIGVWLKP